MQESEEGVLFPPKSTYQMSQVSNHLGRVCACESRHAETWPDSQCDYGESIKSWSYIRQDLEETPDIYSRCKIRLDIGGPCQSRHTRPFIYPCSPTIQEYIPWEHVETVVLLCLSEPPRSSLMESSAKTPFPYARTKKAACCSRLHRGMSSQAYHAATPTARFLSACIVAHHAFRNLCMAALRCSFLSSPVDRGAIIKPWTTERTPATYQCC